MPLMERVELQRSTGRGLDLHMEDFLECIRDRGRIPAANIDIGANVARVALLGNIAFKTGRRLYWDDPAGRFIDDPEADSHLVPAYRAPWRLPEV